MKFERHQVKDLKYLTVVPDNHAPDVHYPLVVMLHGFGANMEDLAGLAPAIESEGYVYVCPNAPIPFELGLGQVGYGWIPPRGQATPEDIQHAEGQLSGFLDEILAQLRISFQRTSEATCPKTPPQPWQHTFLRVWSVNTRPTRSPGLEIR